MKRLLLIGLLAVLCLVCGTAMGEEYDEAMAAFTAAQAKLESAQAAYDEAMAALMTAQTDLESAKSAYEEAEANLSTAQDRLDAAKQAAEPTDSTALAHAIPEVLTHERWEEIVEGRIGSAEESSLRSKKRVFTANYKRLTLRELLNDADADAWFRGASLLAASMADAQQADAVFARLIACTGDAEAMAAEAEALSADPAMEPLLSAVFHLRRSQDAHAEELMLTTLDGIGYTVGEYAADQRYEPGPLVYAPDGEGGLTVSACTGDEREIVIPESVHGMPVTGIAAFAFSADTALERVTIPACVSRIEGNPFVFCKSLSEIVLVNHPDLTVTDGLLIRNSDARVLACLPAVVTGEFTVPSGVRAIGRSAFAGNTGLTGVTLPAGVEELDDGAFAWCNELTRLDLPEGLVRIGEYCLVGSCVSGQSLTHEAAPDDVPVFRIPGTVREISETSLTAWTQATRLYLAGVIPEPGPDTAFVLPGMVFMNVEIGEGCTPDVWNALQEARLETLTIPASLEAIPEDAFPMTNTLREICLADGITNLRVEDGALFSVEDHRLIRVLPECAGETFTVPDGIERIDAGAFRYCLNLKSVTLPDSVVRIGSAAFADCMNLTSLTLPAGLTSIPEEMCAACRALPEIILPETVTEIGASAFNGCNSLTEMTIPDGVTAIGEDAFGVTYNLKRINIPASVTEIGAGALQYDMEVLSFAKELPEIVVVPGSYGETWARETFWSQVLNDTIVRIVAAETADNEITWQAEPWAPFMPDMDLQTFFTASVDGFQSPVAITATQNEDGSVATLEVDASGETFGQWVESPNFTGQFIGKKGPFKLGVDIDAVSGATVTSEAVVEAVNYMFVKPDEENTEVTVTDDVVVTEVFETEQPDTTTVLDELSNEYPWLDFEIVPDTDTTENLTIDLQSAQQTETTSSFGLGEYVGFGGKASSTGFKYKDLADGTIQISDYTGSDTDIVIPAEIDGKRVSVVGDVMGFHTDAITSITIQEGPTEIATYGFSNIKALTDVTLPASLKVIGDMAFYGCEALKTVAIPYGVTQIGEAAFSQTGLTSVTIPGSVETVGPNAFAFCDSLTAVVIEEGVQSVGKEAFIWCESLTGMTLPASLTEIGDGALGMIEGPDGGYYPMGGVTVYAPSGSYAAQYCQNHNLNWKAK